MMSTEDVRHIVHLKMWCDADVDEVDRRQVQFRCTSPDDAARRARWFARRWAASLPDVNAHLAAGHCVEVELLMQCDDWEDGCLLGHIDITGDTNGN